MDDAFPAHSWSPSELKLQVEAERGGEPFLVYRDPAGEQRIFGLGPGRSKATVGREAGIDIRLDGDSEVSRLHAELERIGDEWIVADDGLSRNGSYVNGERLAGKRRLRDGDSLRFGATPMAFRAPAQRGTAGTAAASDMPSAADVSDAQRRVLIALCRPFKEGASYATPATNQQIAQEIFLSVDAVKSHLRALFKTFDVEDVPQNQKRVRLIERAMLSGVISPRDL